MGNLNSADGAATSRGDYSPDGPVARRSCVYIYEK